MPTTDIPVLQPDVIWDRAFRWLCQQRRHAPPNADVWHLRWIWPDVRATLYQRVMTSRYRLSPLQVFGSGHDGRAVWCAQDALVLKWLSLRLRSRLPQHEACMHLQGGMQASLLKVSEAYYHGGYRFVHCTDIRGYYRHIRKCQVMAQVARYVPEPALMSLVSQYVHYSVENGGEFHTPEHGIPRSCALSPLIGGSLLRHIDGCFSSLDQENYFYVRYMDDFLLFTRTRWQLRRAISQLAEYFELSGFERHPDKTQTGRLGRGFDWLGVWFDANGPAIAPRARENHREQCLRLYEQARRQGASDEEARVRVQAYVSRWQRWADRTLMLCLPGN